MVEAKRAHDRQPPGERELQLSEEGARADILLLVQSQRARFAPVVGEVKAVVALQLPLDPEIHAGSSGSGFPAPAQPQPNTASGARQVDHAVGDGVLEFAPDGVGGERSLESAHTPAPAHPRLALPDVLAGAAPYIEAPGLVAALVEELGRQGAPVERIEVDAAELQRQGAPAKGAREAGVQGGARRLAVGVLAGPGGVVAEAVEPALRGAGPVGDLPGGAGSGGLQAQQPVRAAHHGDVLAVRSAVRGRALEEDHPARTVPVQGGRGAAERFNPPQRPDVEVVQGRLAVGKGGGDPVNEDLDAAHAELRAGPEAPDGDPLALRRVVAVLHPHAGQPVQYFLDEHAAVALSKFRPRQHGGGEGHPVQPHRGPENRDDDRRQRDSVPGLELAVGRRREERCRADEQGDQDDRSRFDGFRVQRSFPVPAAGGCREAKGSPTAAR